VSTVSLNQRLTRLANNRARPARQTLAVIGVAFLAAGMLGVIAHAPSAFVCLSALGFLLCATGYAFMLGCSWQLAAEDVQQAGNETLSSQAAAERNLLLRLNLATRVAGITVWEWDLANDRVMIDHDVVHSPGEIGVDGNAFALALERVHPDERATFLANRELSLRSTEPFRSRHRRLCNGVYIHQETISQTLFDADNAPVRMVGVTTDISEQVRHAEQLEQRAADERVLRDRLDLATKTAQIGVWDLDLRTGEAVSDANVFNILNCQNLETKQLWELIHPDDRDPVRDQVELAKRDAASRQLIEVRYRVVHRNCAERHIQSFVRVFRDEQQIAVRILSIMRDVTAEVEHARILTQQAEHERTLLERLHLATETAGISAWEYDFATRHYRWEKGSPEAFDDLFGPITPEQFLSRVHADDRQRFAAVLRRTLEEGQGKYSVRYRTVQRDGVVRHVQMHGHLMLDAHNQPLRSVGVAWDVTAEVETAQQLRIQGDEQRKLLDRFLIATQAANISSWELNLRTWQLEWHQKSGTQLITGTYTDAMSRVEQLQHPEDRNILRETIEQAIRSGNPLLNYRDRLLINGKQIHLQHHARLIFAADGTALTAVGVSWDITREVEAAAEIERQSTQLRDIERRQERASLSSMEGHWEWDLNNLTAWNSSSTHALLGFAPGSLPTGFPELMKLVQLPQDAEWQQRRLDDHLTQGKPYDFETRLRCASGDIRWMRVRGTVERDPSGQPLRMAGSMQDIHQQRLVEEALRLAQVRFQRAITGTQDGLWEVEQQGHAWCSPRVGELLGYAPDELPNDTNFLRKFLHPDDTEVVTQSVRTNSETGVPCDVEVRLQTKSGDYRWFRARASAERDAEGGPLRLSGSLQDVTDARAAREALVQATQTAQAASQAKSHFLANVSHEIRTPMNGIIGMTGLLLDTALDGTQQEYGETIRSSADSLLTIINDILDFSKIEAGKLDIEHLDMDVRSQVEEVGNMMALQAAGKQLELIVHVHPDVPERLKGDPLRLRQCLVNLVGNAIKFTRQGEVAIEVRVEGSRDGRLLTRFEVRDTGMGIAPDTMSTLFEPFVQADSSTTRNFGGTGLGLSIVRRLAEMMHGEVGGHSEVDVGSTFWFMLPLEAATTPAAATVAGSTTGRRVLVVDDNQTHRRVLASQLRHAGYAVDCAGDGTKALQLLHQAVHDSQPYDVVLTDQQMPQMDGATLGRHIQDSPALTATRLILLTSLERRRELKLAVPSGFAAYLNKPLRTRELFDCLERVLARDAGEWQLLSALQSASSLAPAPTSRFSGAVLLTEDNPVNQKVAVRYLERLGLTVQVANQGAEALEACRQRHFDIVFMDLQMPVMDGLTATRLIREHEAISGAATPIIALTANAMIGQREACLAAGMNEFLTKPIDIGQLTQILQQFCNRSVESETTSHTANGETSAMNDSASPPETPTAVVDIVGWRELTEDDDEFMEELVHTFVESSAQVLKELHTALDTLDRTMLARAAHKLKGASANIRAVALCDLAAIVESTAATAEVNELRLVITQMRSVCDLTIAYFDESVVVTRRMKALQA
jgi:two-component system sensor histidine kinase/response regulator